jgi:hypothetical protein
MAAGSVWLLGVWLAVAPSFPVHAAATGSFRQLYQFGEFIGRPGVLAALALLAYVIGILSTSLWDQLGRLSDEHLPVRLYRWAPAFQREGRAFREARSAVESALNRAFIRSDRFRHVIASAICEATEESFDEVSGTIRTSTVDPLRRNSLLVGVVDVRPLAEDFVDDLQHAPARLVGSEARDLYAEYDRMDAEAWFRHGLVLPTAFLFVVLAAQTHPLWLLGLVASISLGYLGARARAESDSWLVAAVSAGRVASPILERIENSDPPIRAAADVQRAWRFLKDGADFVI